MPLANAADNIYMGGQLADAVYAGDVKVWPLAVAVDDPYPLEYRFETDLEGWTPDAIYPPGSLVWSLGGLCITHPDGVEYTYAHNPQLDVSQWAVTGNEYRVKGRATLLEWNGVGSPSIHIYPNINILGLGDATQAVHLIFTTLGQTFQDSSIEATPFDALVPASADLMLQTTAGTGVLNSSFKIQVSLAALINADLSNIEKPPAP